MLVYGILHFFYAFSHERSVEVIRGIPSSSGFSWSAITVTMPAYVLFSCVLPRDRLFSEGLTSASDYSSWSAITVTIARRRFILHGQPVT